MTLTVDTKARRLLRARLGAGLAIGALFAVGAVATPAAARSRDQENLPPVYRYYAAPPVVYGWPYGYDYYAPAYGYYYGRPYAYYGRPYYAPQADYGPGIGWRDPHAGGP